MRSLFNICLSNISKNMQILATELNNLPDDCKALLLEWLVSHDNLNAPEVRNILVNRNFTENLAILCFYSSDQVTDIFLAALAKTSRKKFRQISVIYCCKVGDKGVRVVTENQPELVKLELKGLPLLTSYGIAGVESSKLKFVDLSGCPRVCSSGIIHLVTHNSQIDEILLNNCKAVDDLAVYAIGAHVGKRLRSLELDFLNHLRDSPAAISYLTEHCPNITQLSLCRYFTPCSSNSNFFNLECTLNCGELRELDLHGNYFTVLPKLPPKIANLRLSCTGGENVNDLVKRLKDMTNLRAIRLAVTSRDGLIDPSSQANVNINEFLELFLPFCGLNVTGLQIMVYYLKDTVLRMITDFCTNLTTLSLNVRIINSFPLLNRIFTDKKRASELKSLKFCGLKLSHKLLVTLAKSCTNLEEAEFSFMDCVDDRFLRLLASNCGRLKSLNFNGCKWVTDKGVCALARGCPLREIRLRSTAVTDRCVYALAQCCPQLEWIAHADYSGKPKFSENALQTLKDNCVQRVIC